MRRKPISNNNGGGFNNQHRQQKPRFQGGGQHGGYNRPRKNYGQAREKYLAQARDALAAGDRVLAENYFQHADHCYRMLMEENANRPQPRPVQTDQEQPQDDAGNSVAAEAVEEEVITTNNSALPAFLTGGFEHAAAAAPAAAQNWEERDAE